eukprot:jgi/Ulvmu1/2690/UM014_0146.1
MPTLEQLEHKLRLVEASRRRLQSAPWSTFSRNDTSRQMMSQLAAQLADTEDELSQLKAEHETLQRDTATELSELRAKCGHFEDQQTDIGNLMTQNPAVATEMKKAYVTGKVEVQRAMRRTEKEVDSLRTSLKHAEARADAVRAQLQDVKEKYHEALRQKSTLHRHTSALQERVHSLQAEQVDCISSTMRNTQRAQQMSERVLQSLAKVQQKQVHFKDDGQVSALKAENAILHEMLQTSLPHMDPAAQCLVSTLSRTLRQASQATNRAAAATSAAAQVPPRDGDSGHGPQDSLGGGMPVESGGPFGSAQHSQSLDATEQQAEVRDLESDMMTTLAHVLNNSTAPQAAADSGEAGDNAASSSDSEWSGDEVMEVAEETLRRTACGAQTGSGSMKSSNPAASVPSDAELLQGISGDGAGDGAQPCKMLGTVRRKGRGPKARRDTMELSRVPRLAVRMRAPVNAQSAVSFMQKLAKARESCGLSEQIPDGNPGPFFGDAEHANDHAAERIACTEDTGARDDAQVERAKGVILAAVQRRMQAKAASGGAAAAQHARNKPETVAVAAVSQQQQGAVAQQSTDGSAPAAGSQGMAGAGSLEGSGGPAVPAAASAAAEDELFQGPEGAPPLGVQPHRAASLRMPDVHATSIAVARALRTMGSVRGRDGAAVDHLAAASPPALRVRSVSHSPTARPGERIAPGGRCPTLSHTSTRLQPRAAPPARSRSLSPRHHVPASAAAVRHSHSVVAELQAQTHTMASIMHEHMPWMINEVTRATLMKRDKVDPCLCPPRLSIPAATQAARKPDAAPACDTFDVRLARARGVQSTPATTPRAGGPHPAKEAGDKYAATLMQIRGWRPHAIDCSNARGAITMHPPASRGLRLQQSLLRDTVAQR